MDEAAGLSDDAESIAAIGFEAVQQRIRTNAERVLDQITTTGKAQMVFSDERLHKTIAGQIILRVTFEKDTEVQMIQVKKASLPPMEPGRSAYINVVIGFGETFTHVPRVLQIKSLNRIANSEELKTALVHEATHAVEMVGRRDSGTDFQSNTLRLSKAITGSKIPEVSALWFLMYIIDDSEMNARVAEVGTLMKNADVDAPREELIQSIQQSRVWKEVRSLIDFKADATYIKMVNSVRKNFPDLVPKDNLEAAEKFISDSLAQALNGHVLAKAGHSQTSQRLRKCFIGRGNGQTQEYHKDLMGILNNLQDLFNERGEDLKRRVFKTITLARQAAPTPKPELAEGEEVLDEMAYPASFDRGVFSELRNFTQRIKYCREHLTYLAQGSSRIVFAIDDEKVLKLAKNDIGIAQNEGESMYDMQRDYGQFVAQVFDQSPLDLWIEMEKAVKITPAKFRQITGVDFNDMGVYLSNMLDSGYHRRLDPQKQAFMDDNEFMQELSQLVGNYQLFPGDIAKVNSWGMVRRNGQEFAVLVDFGISSKGFQTHYVEPAQAKANAGRYRHQPYAE